MMHLRSMSIPLWLFATAAAYAQQTGSPEAPAGPGPGTDEMTGQLMFFTLAAGVVIAVGILLYFLRKRSNRDAAERVFNPKKRDTL